MCIRDSAGYGRDDARAERHAERAGAPVAERRCAGAKLEAARDLRAIAIAPASSAGVDSLAAMPAAFADTAARVSELLALRARAGYAPNVHARLAALYLRAPGTRQSGTIEAYAFKTLAPETPDAWRKWAAAQLAEQQYESALRSLERYLELAAAQGHPDAEAAAAADKLRRLVHGDLARAALRP